MTSMTMIEAIRDAHAVAMERDDRVVVFGEDVGYFGGVFRCTQGLQQRFGPHRCFDTPISEAGIVGAAVGMAAYGLRPCVEIQFADYMYPAYDQIVSEAARLRHRSAGDFTAPLTIRMPTGGGIYGGQTHSQSPEALFTHVAGLKTVVVSNPYDAKGLLHRGDRGRRPGDLPRTRSASTTARSTAITTGPIVPWSQHPLGEVPEGHYTIELGDGPRPPRGRATSRCWPTARSSTSRRLLPRSRASTPRSSTCARSCRSTSTRSSRRCARPAAVSSCTRPRSPRASAPSSAPPCRSGAFYHLEAPIARVCGWDTPYPHAHEWSYFPGPDRVGRAMREVMSA